MAVLAVAVSANYLSSPRFDPYARCCSDDDYYTALAGAPEREHIDVPAPYNHRLLTPWLVRILPGSETAGFLSVTLVALFVAVVMFYFCCRELGRDELVAAAATIVLSTTYWFVEFHLVDYALVDPLHLAMLLLAFYISLRNWNPIWVGAIAGVGVLNKEAAVLLVPALLAVYWQRRLLGIPATAAIFVPPVAAVLLLASWGGESEIAATFRTHMTSRYGSLPQLAGEFNGYLLPTWGPQILVFIIGFPVLVRLLREHLALVAIVIAAHLQLLVASDTSRLLMVAALPVSYSVAVVLRYYIAHQGWYLLAVLAVALLQVLYFSEQRALVAQVVGISATGPGPISSAAPELSRGLSLMLFASIFVGTHVARTGGIRLAGATHERWRGLAICRAWPARRK